jgi:hypothetical protein
MDAHAWIEAWDQERNQWSIVEATVGEDSTAATFEEQIEHIGSGAGAMLRQLFKALFEYGLLGLPSWLFESYGILAGSLLLTGALTGILAWLLSRFYRRRKTAQASQSKSINPVLVPLHKMLYRMDRKVETAGPQRVPSETLHAFSQRLRERDQGDGLWTKISDWYREYVLLRYRKTISVRHVQQLEQRAQTLQDSL